MSNSKLFDQFTINNKRDRFSEVTDKRKQSDDEAYRGKVRHGIDHYHAEREFQRMVDSFDQVGG